MASLLGSSTNTKVLRYTGIQIQTSAQGVPISLFWGQQRISPNVIQYDNFESHKQSMGGKGGGGKSGASYTYTAAVVMGLCEGSAELDTILTGGDATTLSAMNLTFYSGTAAQMPPSWLESKFPQRALSYPYTSYLFSPKMDLGSSGTIPNISVVMTRRPFASSVGTPDVNVADVVADFLLNPQYNVGNLSSSDIDIVTQGQYHDYLQAEGIFLSPLLTSQNKATDAIDRWAQLTNSWIYWGGLRIMFVPLGDQVVTGNGVTFTPDMSPAYDLGPDDYLEPIKVTRKDPADCNNRTRLEISDRSNQYNTTICEYKDQTLIDTYGIVETGNISASEICVSSIGAIVAELIGKRESYIRNSYQFTLPYRYIRILPGTIVTLTDPNLGIDHVGVRVSEVSEDTDDKITITAEEFPGVLGKATALPPQPLLGSPTINRLVDPGDVNTPCVFEPNSSYTNNQAQIFLCASGGESWGGCNVFISFDNVTYSPIGDISSPARQGVLTAPLPLHSDPDTADTLSVDLAQSLGEIGVATSDDAASLRTLAVVSPPPNQGKLSVGEMIAYGSVTPTGTYASDLTNLRRGQYGMATAAHTVGEVFTVIDPTGHGNSTLIYSLPQQYIGKTLWLKFSSYNTFGAAGQDLSTVQAYSYVPTGIGFGAGTGGVPQAPSNFRATAGVNQITLEWDLNASIDNVKTYTLYAAAGMNQPFKSAGIIYTGLSAGYAYTGVRAEDSFTFFLTATNAVGMSSPTAGISIKALLDSYALQSASDEVAAAQARADALLAQVALLAASMQQDAAIAYQAVSDRISASLNSAVGRLSATIDVANTVAVNAGQIATAVGQQVTTLGALVGPNDSAAAMKIGTSATSSGAAATWGVNLTASDGTHSATGGISVDVVVEDGVATSVTSLTGDAVALTGNTYFLPEHGQAVALFSEDGIDATAITTGTLNVENLIAPGVISVVDIITASHNETISLSFPAGGATLYIDIVSSGSENITTTDTGSVVIEVFVGVFSILFANVFVGSISLIAEKSYDNITWVQVGTPVVLSSKNTQGFNSNTVVGVFSDASPIASQTYYRSRMVVVSTDIYANHTTSGGFYSDCQMVINQRRK